MSELKVALIYLGRKGGGEIYSLEVARALSKKAKVLAVVSKQVFNLRKWQEIGLDLIEISTYKNLWQFFFSSLNFKKFLFLRKQIKKFNPDVIYYPMFHIWVPLINFLFPSLPKVFTLHDPIPHKGEENLVISFLQKIAIRQATRIIILSKSHIEVMEKQGISREKIDVIPHGEFSYYSQFTSTNLKINENNPPTILFFGRILPYKGLDILLKAFPLIKKEIPEAKLIIAGPGDFSLYQKQVNNLKDVIIVNRWLKDEEVAFYFKQASICVLPYIEATQSGIIPIAYTFKAPVVATQVGGIPEQVEDGKTGLLVPAGNIEKLAEACVYLLKNPSLIVKMGEAGYEKAMKEWSWETIAYQLLISFEKAIEDYKANKI